jgi:glutathione S-transferase
MITVHHLNNSRSQRVLWPKLVDFLSRIHARDAYRRALERGGPYKF